MRPQRRLGLRARHDAEAAVPRVGVVEGEADGGGAGIPRVHLRPVGLVLLRFWGFGGWLVGGLVGWVGGSPGMNEGFNIRQVRTWCHANTAPLVSPSLLVGVKMTTMQKSIVG